LIALAPDWFGWFIFGEPGNVHLVLLTAGCLATVIAYNFATELFTALRQMRAVSIMAMVNSVLFAAIGVGLLSLRQDAGMILIAYGVACATTALVAVAALWRITSQSPTDTASLAHGALWTRLMPFAVGVWVTNLLVNLFAVSDRYMIMHFSGLDRDAAAALVGNYHSSRVVPVLLASIAGMVGGMLLPYLSRDWEAGRRDAASDQVNLVLKAFGLLLFAAGIGVLAFSPFLFTVVLAGKYASGLDVLPWTTVYCIWFSLSLLAGSYLWCAERPRMTCLIYFLGLLGNVALNAVLVPRWGLPGAVWATAAANGLALALSLLVAYRLGLKRDAGVWLPVVVPLALPLGAPIAFVVLAAVAWIAVRTNWIFTVDQRQQFFAALAPYWRKFAPTPAAESTTPG
ncbi:MAG: lipopolysaccharide biosynthesis protein, partial [Planctomycetales bacterium]|nr:lipopolysaccharide biosynthesis protein [Planctomycetales bacterium]